MTNIVTTVEGWRIISHEGVATVRDTDLAFFAGVERARSIRVTVRTLIEDGAIAIGDITNVANTARVFEVPEVVENGKGRSQNVTAYHLTEEAALLVLTRLRTPSAIDVTKAIVNVFVQVKRGSRHEGIMTDALVRRVEALEELNGGLARQLTALVQQVGCVLSKVQEHASNPLVLQSTKTLGDGTREARQARKFLTDRTRDFALSKRISMSKAVGLLRRYEGVGSYALIRMESLGRIHQWITDRIAEGPSVPVQRPVKRAPTWMELMGLDGPPVPPEVKKPN